RGASAHAGAVAPADESGEDDDEGGVGGGFFRADDRVDHDDAGQAEGGAGEQEGERGALSHAAAEQALQDGDLGERGEIHERAGDGGEGVGRERISADGLRDPGGGDQAFVSGSPEQKTGDEHAADEQREDLFGVGPGLIEPIAGFAAAAGGAPGESGDGGEHGGLGVGGREQGERGGDRGGGGGSAGGQGEQAGVTGGGPAPVGEDQDGDHDAEEDCRLPQRAAGRRGRERGEPGGLGALLAAEEQVHGDADDDGEHDGADRAGDAELKAED